MYGYPVLWRLVVVAVVVVVAAVSGYLHGVQHERGRQALEEQERWAARESELRAALDASRRAAAQTARLLDAERASRRKDRLLFERKLADVSRGTTYMYGHTVDAHTVDKCTQVSDLAAILDADIVRVWDSAVALGTTAAERPEWTARADASAGAATVEDALRHLADVASLLGECRVREQAMRSWVCGAGLASCE